MAGALSPTLQKGHQGPKPQSPDLPATLCWHPQPSPQACKRPGAGSACDPRGRAPWWVPQFPWCTCATSRLDFLLHTFPVGPTLGPGQPGARGRLEMPEGPREAVSLGCWILLGSIPVPPLPGAAQSLQGSSNFQPPPGRREGEDAQLERVGVPGRLRATGPGGGWRARGRGQSRIYGSWVTAKPPRETPPPRSLWAHGPL